MVLRKSFMGFSITEIVSVLTIAGMLIGFLILTTNRITASETKIMSLEQRQNKSETSTNELNQKIDKIIFLLMERK